MKLLFLIATCERPKMLENLIRQIRAQCRYEYRILIINDGSKKSYNGVVEHLRSGKDWYYKYDIKRGKKNYWQTVDRLFRQAHQYEFDYAYKLDDDIELHPSAIQKSVQILEHLTNRKKKIVLNMWVDHRAEQTIWTGVKPRLTNLGGRQLRKIGWVDGGNWVANRKVFEAINWACPQPPDKWWDRKGGDSSGVGKYLSVKMIRKACRIYMPMESLVYHGGHDSIMHWYKNDEDRPINMKNKPWDNE